MDALGTFKVLLNLILKRVESGISSTKHRNELVVHIIRLGKKVLKDI
jgi:hypothetical protein